MALSEHYYMQPPYYSGDDIILDLADEKKPDVMVQRLTSPNNQQLSNASNIEEVPYLVPVPVSNANDIDYEDTYIKNLTIAGQGTIGLELKATKKGIRIALNSNEKLSSDNNAMILDI